MLLRVGYVRVKPGPHKQQCRSNIVEATGNFVACCFDNVAVFGNNVKATFDIVTFDNVASTLLLVWTGLKCMPPGPLHNCLLSPVHTSNNVEATFDFVFKNGNNVKRVYRKISFFRQSRMSLLHRCSFWQQRYRFWQ